MGTTRGYKGTRIQVELKKQEEEPMSKYVKNKFRAWKLPSSNCCLVVFREALIIHRKTGRQTDNSRVLTGNT